MRSTWEMKRVEIISIGKELLTGRVLDTNSHWLAGQVTLLGGQVKRMATVDDEVEAIAAELRASMGNGARVILTTGGLGPTFDDCTLAGVARAVGRPLQLNPQALEFVKDRYANFKEQGFVESDEVTPPREKMAFLPRGAQMLPNPVGAAPGSWWEGDQVVISSLPGVPGELKAIFQESVAPRLREIFGSAFHLEEVIDTPMKDESLLTQILQEVSLLTPHVHLKSKPTHFGPDVRLEVCLTAWGEDRERLENELLQAIEEIRKRLRIAHG